MKSYFIYTVVSLGSSYGLYYILLRKQKTFQFNRFFLLISLVLCLLAPSLEFEIFKFVPSITEIPIETLTGSKIIYENLEDISIHSTESVGHSQKTPFFYVYFIITLFMTIRFFKNLFQIHSLTRVESERMGRLRLIKSKGSEMASSFFNYLFINEQCDLEDQDCISIIKHETVHFKELHTADVILIELLICMFWFNPFIWFYKKAMLQNHEYIADDQSVSSGIDIKNYSNTIINLGHKEHRVPLTSGFNFIQIKNRIIMLHQSKTSLLNRTFKICSVILLFSGIFIFSSYKDKKEPLVVVIDAGHGGEDSGQLTTNTKEKDIVLNISNSLKALSNDKLKIITTRGNDEFLSLEDRIKFINKQEPDIVLSLHCNAHSNNKVSGVEAYYYESENAERQSESIKYSSLIASKLIDYGFDDAKIAAANFKIIKEVESPAVLLEIGFLTNSKDNALLKDISQQQEIAKTIYNAILIKD